MKGELYTFSGIDCSGKSTQIRLLRARLEEQGQRVAEVWLRPGYSRELDALRRLVRRIRPETLPTPGQGAARARAFRSPAVQRAWVAMAFADVLTQYGVRLRMLLASGQTVLCDRYVGDAALDMELRFPSVRTEWLFGAASRLCPRPRRAFLLMLPEQEMLRRMALKEEPFPDEESVRRVRYSRYRDLATSRSYTNIEASASAREVHEQIWRELGK